MNGCSFGDFVLKVCKDRDTLTHLFQGNPLLSTAADLYLYRFDEDIEYDALKITLDQVCNCEAPLNVDTIAHAVVNIALWPLLFLLCRTPVWLQCC